MNWNPDEPELSYLDLDQPVGGLREHGELGQFAAHHGDFITLMEARADAAVFVDLVGQIFTLGHGKSQAGEEFRNARKQTDGADVVFTGLCQQRLHQTLAASRALAVGIDGNRANFGQMRTVKMECATANNVSVIFEDNEVAHVLADFGKGTREQPAIARV